MSNPSSLPVTSKTIELPEDRPTQLFVLAIASNSMMYHYFTPERYDNEILQQEVTGLTHLSRDLDTGYNRRLAGEKRARGLINDVGNESLVKRPPNWMVVGAILLVGISVIAYGQYNPSFGAGISAYWNANSGYVIVAAILLVAFVLMLRFRRRRQKG